MADPPPRSIREELAATGAVAGAVEGVEPVTAPSRDGLALFPGAHCRSRATAHLDAQAGESTRQMKGKFRKLKEFPLEFAVFAIRI
ncbi:hypothetical protein GCM10009753_60320 [Streptantibioticus ferralitis]